MTTNQKTRFQVYYCGTMVDIRSMGVGVGEHLSEDSFVRFGAKPTQRACAQDILWNWKKTRKYRIPEKNREELAIVRERQGSEREAAAEGGVGTCRLWGQVGQRERISQRSW